MVLLLAVAGMTASGAAAETGYRLLELDGKLLKWGGRILGQGARVTYAVAAGRLDSPHARHGALRSGEHRGQIRPPHACRNGGV